MAKSRRSNSTNDYLWISPEGRAFAGIHYQLILQFMAASASNCAFSTSELSHIRWQLKQSLPGCYISSNDLEAIAEEFATLEPTVRHTLKQELFQQHDVDINNSIEDSLKDPDARLYEQAEAELVEDYNRRHSSVGTQSNETFTHTESSSFTPESLSSTTTNEVQHVAATRDARDVVSDTCNDVNGDTHSVTISKSPSTTNNNLQSEISAALNHNTPGRQRCTPQTRYNLTNGMSPMADVSSRTPSIDDNLQITPENARLYAPVYLAALTEMRYGKSSIKFEFETDREDATKTTTAESSPITLPVKTSPSTVPKSITTSTTASPKPPPGYPVLPKIRRPNPSSYIKHAHGKVTIPACEAKSFTAWFGHSVQSVPEKIEGYAWYCDRCYVAPTSTSSKATVKLQGKFISKSAAQKHFDKIHDERWKPVLPEPERETGMLSKTADESAKIADRGPQVYVDPEPAQVRIRLDRRSLNGLRALDTPALMNVDDSYKYRPRMTRRVLFQDELALRETDANAAVKDDSFKFEDLQCDEENTKPEQTLEKGRHGGKQSAWRTYATEPPQLSERKVKFSEEEHVKVIEPREDKEGRVLRSRIRSSV